ncbi:MBT domain-containing protein 1 [Parasteatoda tepidariorum]|uniref:MBT domain-containing protein 1 n=1 Tax=Parasteatoda tepidariorum TaxID=114398 RepID=UPI00077FAFA9|nr:MBT domain-containing protein 1 [Parasteatoda tepidariorum]
MIEGSHNWRSYLSRNDFVAAPVSCFKHVALSRSWDSITAGILVEVRSPDCTTCCPSTPCCYWIAAVVKVSGYLGLLRYEGFESDSSQDFWLNLCSNTNIHPIGWCAENGMPLVPPKCIEDKHTDWKDYLMRRISRSRTIPADFSYKVEEHKHTTIKKGMNLEVVDKNLISAVRPATVSEVIGGRLHVKYDDTEASDDGFWCHEKSSLIHPVGWAQIIGHALKSKPEYAMQSLKKTLFRTFDSNDATWDMFLPACYPNKNMKYKEGMKLEAIDPLNLSTICVATVLEVLRDNYLMIGIDGMATADGSDSFCYHASSPYIFPVGFCESNSIDLTPPKGYKGEFKWHEYLKKAKAKPAPYALFQRDIPNHGFIEGMYLEAVDLMEPRLICIASVTKVIGSLLRIHFEGWDVAYDQWCDCESPDLFPVGWCEVLGYRLEPPRSDETEDNQKSKKLMPGKIKRGRKKMIRKKNEDFGEVTVKKEPDDNSDLYSGTAALSVEDSNSGSG